jgi:hypothetical protein
MGKKTITITATMEERWVGHFCSMLKYMEDMGELGHSCAVGFYSDGGGDFRPKFDFDTEYAKQYGKRRYEVANMPELEVIFDAG